MSSNSCCKFDNSMSITSLKKRIVSRHKVIDRRKKNFKNKIQFSFFSWMVKILQIIENFCDQKRLCEWDLGLVGHNVWKH